MPGRANVSRHTLVPVSRYRFAVASAWMTTVVLSVGCSHTESSGDASSSSPTARPDDTTPVAAVWAVPQRFLGEWSGTASDGRGGYQIVLTINSGKNAEEMGASVVTERATGVRCERVERLLGAGESDLTLAARSLGGDACANLATVSTVRLLPDGSLTYAVAGGSGAAITGNLRHR
ncbi:hypothetical protein DFR76_102243 [Nocardia pseudobrasiliensis]|uniref:Uncharacterized protein n=2 Tax=Nocardia pseudobrasiliensis TaxID=45979 RepID=A0A370IAU6_9NOCA|nr:hypothetical protein DFR76_102243 [Nocardia pseudobrasiliensis]